MSIKNETSAMNTVVSDFTEKWVGKHDRSDFEKELMDLFINMHIHCSKVALKTSLKPAGKNGKFGSATAKELATEHGLNEKDLEGSGKNGKILLKDVEKAAGVCKKKRAKKSPKKKEKHKCHGLTKKGDPCGVSGTQCPDGSKHWYCFRHATDDKWKMYEDDSESDSDREGVIDGMQAEEYEEEEDPFADE